MMTQGEAEAELEGLAVTEAIPVATAARMFRDWERGAIRSSVAVEILARLTPSEMMEVLAFAERKLSRRNRRR